jgi:hypothetical protein
VLRCRKSMRPNRPRCRANRWVVPLRWLSTTNSALGASPTLLHVVLSIIFAALPHGHGKADPRGFSSPRPPPWWHDLHAEALIRPVRWGGGIAQICPSGGGPGPWAPWTSSSSQAHHGVSRKHVWWHHATTLTGLLNLLPNSEPNENNIPSSPSSHHHQVVSTPGLKWQRGVALLANGDDGYPSRPLGNAGRSTISQELV